MNSPRRAVIYCRTSTDEQFYYNWSIETQLDLCTQYAEKAGYSVVGDYRDSFTGTVLERPKLNALRDVVRAGGADVVICHCIDRLAREPVDGLYLEREFTRAGASVEYAAELYPPGIDGELLKMFRLWVAKMERSTFLRRSHDAMCTRAKNGGISPGRSPVYGYTYDPAAKTYVICEPEAEVVRRIFAWYTEEKIGYGAITARLNRHGVPARQVNTGRQHRPLHRPGKWHESNVGLILHNETYVGRAYYNKTKSERSYTPDGKVHRKRTARDRSEWILIPVPAIVDTDTFEAAQRQSVQNRDLAKRNTKKPYLMRGRIRCATCETTFAAQSNSRSYRCIGNRARTGADGLTSHCKGYVTRSIFDEQVWAEIKGLLLHPDNLIASHEGYIQAARQAAAEVERQLAVVCTELDALQATKARIMEQIIKGIFTDDEAASMMVEVRQQITGKEGDKRRLQQQIATQPIDESAGERLRDFCEQIAAGIDYLTPDEQRRIIDMLDVRAVVSRHESGYVAALTGGIPLPTIATSTVIRTGRNYHVINFTSWLVINKTKGVMKPTG